MVAMAADLPQLVSLPLPELRRPTPPLLVRVLVSVVAKTLYTRWCCSRHSRCCTTAKVVAGYCRDACGCSGAAEGAAMHAQ